MLATKIGETAKKVAEPGRKEIKKRRFGYQKIRIRYFGSQRRV
jgi:hypothetical protein